MPPCPSPSPPCAWRSLPLSIYLCKGTLSPPLPCWLQGSGVLAISQSLAKFGEEGSCCGSEERNGSFCGSVEGRSPWQLLPEQNLAVRAARLAQRAKQSLIELQSLPQAPICCLLCWCCSERQGSVCLQGVWERGSHSCDSVPFTCLCFLCAWALPLSHPCAAGLHCC